MLKPPIILPIAPSKYWLSIQCLLLAGLAALSYWVGGKLILLAIIGVGSALTWRAYVRQPSGELYLTSTASLFHGRWVLPADQQPAESGPTLSEEYQVQCDYLGPWLIGLYIGKQRVWLWPDSAPSESLREVRKLFHRPGR